MTITGGGLVPSYHHYSNCYHYYHCCWDQVRLTCGFGPLGSSMKFTRIAVIAVIATMTLLINGCYRCWYCLGSVHVCRGYPKPTKLTDSLSLSLSLSFCLRLCLSPSPSVYIKSKTYTFLHVYTYIYIYV